VYLSIVKKGPVSRPVGRKYASNGIRPQVDSLAFRDCSTGRAWPVPDVD